MWQKLLGIALGMAGNPILKRLIMALINQLVNSATTMVPEVIELMKKANSVVELDGFSKLAYVAKELKEAHPDMAMDAIVNITSSVYSAYKEEIKTT
jgi:hypothetical protein